VPGLGFGWIDPCTGHDTVRSVLCFLLVVGCTGGVEDLEIASQPDAGVPEADAADRPSEASRGCEALLKDPTGIVAGRAGGAGGGKGPVITCGDPVNERMIGVAVRMSNQATVFGAPSAHAVGIACARVTIGQTGTPDVGPVSMVEVSGLGTYDWAPSTWTPVTQCKPGSMLSGLVVHTGTGGNLFVDVSIVCSPLGADGTAGTSETIKVMGSLTDANGPDEVKCAAGEVLAQVGAWTGAGIDALDLSCSRPTCR
jgi:hypothetical protein